RGDQLGGHREGPVPGRDDPVYAARIVPGQDELARARGWQDSTFEALEVLRRYSKVLGRLVHLAQRFRHHRLALVESEQVSQLLAAALDRLRDPVQPPRSLETLEAGHRGPRPVGGLDGALRIGARALRDLRDGLAGGRADRVESLAALRLDPLAVDEHLLDRAGDVDSHLVFSKFLRPDPSSNARA